MIFAITKTTISFVLTGKDDSCLARLKNGLARFLSFGPWLLSWAILWSGPKKVGFGPTFALKLGLEIFTKILKKYRIRFGNRQF
jgi:hypothetical protein